MKNQVEGERIIIPYHMPELPEPIKGTVLADGVKAQEITTSDGEISIDIKSASEPLKVEIEINRLWSSSVDVEMQSEDNRQLGIMVSFGGIRVD